MVLLHFFLPYRAPYRAPPYRAPCRWGPSQGPRARPAANLSVTSARPGSTRLARLWVWLAFLRIWLDFGLISGGFWLRLDFGLILVWFDLDLG